MQTAPGLELSITLGLFACDQRHVAGATPSQGELTSSVMAGSTTESREGVYHI